MASAASWAAHPARLGCEKRTVRLPRAASISVQAVGGLRREGGEAGSPGKHRVAWSRGCSAIPGAGDTAGWGQGGGLLFLPERGSQLLDRPEQQMCMLASHTSIVQSKRNTRGGGLLQPRAGLCGSSTDSCLPEATEPGSARLGHGSLGMQVPTGHRRPVVSRNPCSAPVAGATDEGCGDGVPRPAGSQGPCCTPRNPDLPHCPRNAMEV